MHDFTNYNLPLSPKPNKPSQLLTHKILTKHLDAIGFNTRIKTKQIIKILPIYNIQAINKIQKKLIQQIKQIDNSLQKRYNNMKYIHGLLLDQGINKQLIRSFQKIIKNRIDCIQNGFYLWKLRQINNKNNNNSYDNSQLQLVTSRLIQSPKKFSQILIEKSIANLKQYQLQRHQQSIKQINQRWNYSIKVNKNNQDRLYRFKTQVSPNRQSYKLSNYTAEEKMESQQFTPNLKLNNKISISTKLPSILNISISKNKKFQSKNTLKKVQNSKIRQQIQTQHPTLQQLHTILQKQENIISLWVPPSSYPQLLGILSIQIKQKQYKTQTCHIKKYLIYKHGINRKLFNNILQFIIGKYPKVQYLSLIVNKNQYHGFFIYYGWKGYSWINQEKIKIIYKKQQQKIS